MNPESSDKLPIAPDEGVRFWREEKTDGAVYNVYLKKVKYTSLSELESADANQVAQLQWQTQKIQVIKAGTLERLVESLASEKGELDSTYVNIFLATYRTFASAKDVMTLLLERYKVISKSKDLKDDVKEKHKKTLKSVISMWLDSFPEDFRDPPNYSCLSSLESYAVDSMPDSDLGIRARHRREKFRKEEETDHGVGDVNFRFSLCDEVDFIMDTEYHRPLEFMSIPHTLFAEQLTYMDAELFKKLVPHHCLGAVWSNRDKKEVDTPSVLATVNQFNAVSYRVIATILKNPELKSSQRAKIIIRWLNIAQELRVLKNFSSLKAIVSGLQSLSVYRLRKVWNALGKDSAALALYEELASLFSEENNQIAHRELLNKEGTAKYADMGTWGRRRKGGAKRRSQSEEGGSGVQGTVPYLGTFLTDLTMIDTAIPDTTEDGLINFEKRRKEFEVLAQIKLYQSAAQIYNIQQSEQFLTWFKSVRVYDENESYELSCDIEPIISPKHQKLKKKSSFGSSGSYSRKTSNESMSSCGTSLEDSLGSAGPSSYTGSPGPMSPPFSPKQLSSTSASRSLESVLDGFNITAFKNADNCVIKVSLETPQNDTVYKAIMLGNGDHTHTVIKSVLEKYNIEDNHREYCICQVLPDGTELHIPDTANVFYAMNNSAKELNFIVRKKKQEKISGTMTLGRKFKQRKPKSTWYL